MIGNKRQNSAIGPHNAVLYSITDKISILYCNVREEVTLILMDRKWNLVDVIREDNKNENLSVQIDKFYFSGVQMASMMVE